jgi:tetratricopeptide (TPR) repeat protein
MSRPLGARCAGMLVALALVARAATAAAASCIDWPRAIAEAEISRTPQGPTVLVEPAKDYTKKAGDDWMVLGLRDYIADLLRAAPALRVLAGPTASQASALGGPNFIVGATFQHVETNLRVFIRLSEGQSGQLIAQQTAQFPYPANKGFFTAIAAAVAKIAEAMKVKLDDRAVSAVRDATASTEAYQNFAQGRQALETYRVDKVRASEPFFAAAKRIDYRSPLGYQGLVALHAFLGLDHKMRGEAFAGDYQKAQNEYVRMAEQTGKTAPAFGARWSVATKREGAPSKLDDRFLAGNAAYVEGVQAAEVGNVPAAVAALRRAVALVPEDALAWYHLARAESQAGNEPAAQEARAKAFAISACLER